MWGQKRVVANLSVGRFRNKVGQTFLGAVPGKRVAPLEGLALDSLLRRPAREIVASLERVLPTASSWRRNPMRCTAANTERVGTTLGSGNRIAKCDSKSCC